MKKLFQNLQAKPLVMLIVLAVNILALTGCATKFERVDFKYTSDAHLQPSARFIDVKEPPAKVSGRIREFLSKCGGTILEQQDNLNFYYAPAQQSDENWSAARAVFEKEWEAYKKNDPALYNSINRQDPKLSMPEITKIDGDKVRSSFLSASMAPRTGETIRSLANAAYFVGIWAYFVDWKHDENIDTILRVWWWQDEGATKVYARAVPRMIDYKVEASPGAWVAHNLWQTTTGVADAAIVQQLFSYVKGDTNISCAKEAAAK